LNIIEYRGDPFSRPAIDAGMKWLAPLLGDIAPGRITIAAGARSALMTLMSDVVGPGGTMLTEALTWPTARALAEFLGIKLVPVEMDADGILPEAIDEACKSHNAKALYCVPTAQNPTGALMSVTRRHAVADVARRRGLTIIEDDAYGRLVNGPPPIAALAPDVTTYVGGLAKCLASGFRVAYVVTPDERHARRVSEILRLTMLIAPPIEMALATKVILDDTADTVLSEIRAEMSARNQLAADRLAGLDFVSHPGALHLWLSAPLGWSRAELLSHLSRRDIRVLPSDSFVVAPSVAPDAVRIAVGGPTSFQELDRGLTEIGLLLSKPPTYIGDGA
jgi:DNA-binding transcriptional MocR family regulator